jgi:hypothetical protein
LYSGVPNLSRETREILGILRTKSQDDSHEIQLSPIAFTGKQVKRG